MEDGTIRLQSQLMVGRCSVDFILENNELKHWSHAHGGFDFHKTDIPFEIVDNIEEMKTQNL